MFYNLSSFPIHFESSSQCLAGYLLGPAFATVLGRLFLSLVSRDMYVCIVDTGSLDSLMSRDEVT